MYMYHLFFALRRQLEKEEKERKEQARREEEQRLLEEEKGKGKKRGALNKVQDQSKNLGGGSSRPESAASTQLRQASLVNPSAVSMGNTESTNAGRYVACIVNSPVYIHVLVIA